MNLTKGWFLGFVLLLLPVRDAGADSYLYVPISSLTLKNGTLPERSPMGRARWQLSSAFHPYAVLEGEGEVYIDSEESQPWRTSALDSVHVAIRVPERREISGRLFFPVEGATNVAPLKFTVEATQATTDAKAQFFQTKERSFRNLRNQNIPGGAWFRHQELAAAKARGAQAADDTPRPNRGNRGLDPFDSDTTYELFSGGRAISENLQLDRGLVTRNPGEETVALTNLVGITVKEMNWKSLVGNSRPLLDALAASIPFDQHALFFPSFQAMITVIDEADDNGTPVLQLWEPRAEDANSRVRYQKQLCLELNEVSRLLGPQVISSVAFTGSDPYLRTGTDLGILFETKSPGVLKTFLAAKYNAAHQANPEAKLVSGEIEGTAFTGVVSADRSISSYMATVEKIVLISNSRYQLAALLGASKGTRTNLASQGEYLFFRTRYAKGLNDETAFLVMSDAAIRRWCGPRWRIGNSRRTRAAAVMSEVQAARLARMTKTNSTAGSGENDSAFVESAGIQSSDRGVSSETFGTLEFLTPIAELPLDKVSQAEADAYNRWRDGYQANWQQAFDPIAARFSVKPERVTAELTVMPLIMGTDYRQFIDLTRGAKLKPDSGDRHPESLLHLAMSIHPQSETIKRAGNFLTSMNPTLRANPLGWLGQCVAIYADQDPFWENVRRAENGERFLETNYFQLPVAIHFEVNNALGLAVFLTGLRSYVDQTAPKMTVWQNAEYKGQPYVKITASPAAGENSLSRLGIYYAATPKSLVLTLNETVLKRTLDRQAAGQTAKANTKSELASAKPWLGTNVSLQISQQFFGAIDALSRQELRSSQQLLSWNNLPILNEWRRLFPTEDPVQVHEKFWQTRLTCPGGGGYAWNDRWQTMESAVYGHPGEPKPGPGKFGPLSRLTGANLGLSFEDQGLSAKGVLDRDPRK